MGKISISPNTFLYPMPTTIVGANVNGKPAFLTIAYCGIVQRTPPMISIASNKAHYTNAGIKENRTFSVNIPSEEMVEVTDYLGLFSGRNVDKSAAVENFYGGLKTAPMIKECPLNMECRLVQTIDNFGANEIFLGEITAIYTEEKYLNNGVPDISKIKPIIFSMGANNYWKLGEYLGKAWSIGKGYKPKAGS